MKLTLVTANNFKGHDTFTFTPGPVTVVTGRNETGKTARLDAITLALLGYHPAAGKKAGEILAKFGHSKRDRMNVTAAFDDGSFIERDYRRTETGGSCKVMGGNIEVPAVMLDAQAYFSLGDRDRMKLVATILGTGDTLTADRIKATLENASVPFAAAASVGTYASEAKAFLGKPGANMQAVLDELVAWAKGKVSTAKQAHERQVSAVRALVEVAAPATPLNWSAVELLAALETELTAAQDQLAKLSATVPVKLSPEDIAGLESEIEQLTEQRDPTDEALKQEEAALKSDLAKPSRLDELFDVMTAKWNAFCEAKRILEAVRADKKTLSDEMDTVHRLKACPVCKACGEGQANPDAWKIAWAAEINERAGKLDQQLPGAEQAFNDAESAHSAAKADVTAERQRIDLLSGKQKRLAWVRGEVDDRRLDDLRVADLRKQIADQSLPIPPEFTALHDKVQELLTRKGVLAGEAQAVRDHRAREQQRAQIQGKANEAEGEQKLAVAIYDALLALQFETVEKAFAPLLRAANEMMDGLLTSKLEFNAERGGEIGRRGPEGNWIPHDVFTESEKAKAYTAISVALAVKSRAKIVLVDEIGRIDPVARAGVLTRAAEWVRTGLIDQFIATDPDASYYSTRAAEQGITVIKLG